MKSILDRTRTAAKALFVALFFGCSTTVSVAQTTDKTLFLISNSHLDTQWNWDVTTTIGEYLNNTLKQNIALLDKYPAFRINFEGAIKYMWMKEYYPDLYSQMKQYIATDRWHVSGMAVDANDCMVPSAESMFHSMLYANRFYKQEFGVRGGYDIMLPDCFGFSYAIPSVAKHCGLKGFHTNKLSWGSAVYDQLPPFGIWQGVDGSQIYAVYKPGAYDAHEDFNKDMTTDADMLATINDNQSKYGVPAMFRYVGPRSDHGGGLGDDSSSSGNNTPYWMNLSAQKTTGDIKVKLASPDEFFDYLATCDQSKLQVWNSELPMRVHGVGGYSSRGELKMWNRRDELLGDAAEKASSLAHWLGTETYPTEIRDAWVRMLWQQHHDGITGTSISKAYEYSHNEYYIANKQFGMALTNAMGSLTKNMNTNVDGTPIVVYNPLSQQRTDIVEGEMACETEPEGIRVFDKDNKEVLSQITGYDNTSKTLRFIFAATVPSLGYSQYSVKVGEASTLTSDLSVDETTRSIDNGKYKVRLNSKGDPSVVNAKTSSTIMGYSRMQMLSDYEGSWPAWEISYNTVKQSVNTYVDENVDIQLAENGPLRKSFRVQRTKNGSSFVQYIRMSALTDRIDCVTEVDWQSRQTLLKVQFPFMFASDEDTYDISLGTLKRGVREESCYEVQGHQWADHTNSDGTQGISILNDSKYGWDKPNRNSLRLTLIHTPGCGAYKHQAEQDIGPHNFTYAFYPHEGNWSEATQKEAARLNQPLMAFIPSKHEGALPAEMSLASVSTDKVSIKALKKAEDSDELIVRVYEWTGEDQNNVKITFPAAIESAREVNGLEEEVGLATFSGSELTFSIGHYQPKTFAVKLAKYDLTTTETTSTPVEMKYNLDIMSYDSSKGNASSSFKMAYPAELIGDNMTVDGIPFTMGSRADGSPNAMRCNTSKTLTFDRKEGQNKLYLLMASGKEEGSVASVHMGDTTVELNLPYYVGYAGQPLTPFNLEQTYCKENIAFVATHAHNVSSKSNEISKYLYMYKYCVELPDGVNQVSISSDNRYGLLFAATLSDNKNDDLKEFTKVNTLIEYKELGDNTKCGERLTPSKIVASHQISSNESAAKANDDDLSTKWCVTGSQSETPYLEYQFDNPVEVCSYLLFNAGIESIDWVTRDFRVQRYDEESAQWVDVDVVTQNIENKVERAFTPFTAKKVRLQVEHGENSGTTTRVYEFALYGKTQEASGIATVGTSGSKEATYFTASGVRVSQPVKGVNLVRRSDNTTKKVLVN